MSPITHTAFGLLGWRLFSRRKDFQALFLFILISILADLDFLFYLIPGGRRVFPHQLFTHNLVFALSAAALLSFLAKTGREKAGLFVTSFFHLILDVFTIDEVAPQGIRLFYPFSKAFVYSGVLPNLYRGSVERILSFHNMAATLFEVAVFFFPVMFFFRKDLAFIWKPIRIRKDCS
jgi:membrane-bound metal-dependent hydrolase YbcI (DUF457 family)